jgi:hypothetical protein
LAQAIFSYEGISARATLGSDEDIQWLKEFLAPWFDISNEAPDVEIQVTHDPARFQQLFRAGPDGSSINAFMLDTRCTAYPTWNIAGEDIAYYDDTRELLCLVSGSKVELVCKDAKVCTRTRVMRIIRELAMGAAQLTGSRFLHASAFEVNGLAAIITGPRQAGKTSLLSYVLANSTAGYLSNDRVLLKNIGSSTQLRGMPTMVSIRDGTLEMFPGMQESIIDHSYNVNATLRECQEPEIAISPLRRPGRYSLSPCQFTALLKSEPVREADAGVLIFPRQTGLAGGLELQRLDTREARIRLDACLFGHIGPDQLSDVFTRHPGEQNLRKAPDDESLLLGLSRTLPAYDCQLGSDAYADSRGVEQLLQVLDSGDGK